MQGVRNCRSEAGRQRALQTTRQAGLRNTFSHIRSVLRRPFRFGSAVRYPPYGDASALIKRVMNPCQWARRCVLLWFEHASDHVHATFPRPPWSSPLLLPLPAMAGRKACGEPGETFSRIAERYGVSTSRLMQSTAFRSADLIPNGHQPALRRPGRASAAFWRGTYRVKPG